MKRLALGIHSTDFNRKHAIVVITEHFLSLATPSRLFLMRRLIKHKTLSILAATLVSCVLSSLFILRYGIYSVPSIHHALPIRQPEIVQTSTRLTGGHWVPSLSHTNDTLRLRDGSNAHDCTQTPSVLKEGNVRSQDVDRWEWVLADGQSILEWDTDAFIIRCLQSRIGMILVGGM